MYAGIDVGILWTKAVVLHEGRIAGWSIRPTGDNCAVAGSGALDDALRHAGSAGSSVDAIVSTGIGKNLVDGRAGESTEVVCAAKGIRFLHPSARGVIDIGGESTRVIKLDPAGDIVDYAINDKCASGTGVFLDAMAKLMGVTLDEMGPLSLESTTDVDITSTCVVFAESEVVSQVHRQTPKKDIIKGLHRSIATRVFGMVHRVGLDDDNIAIGGLAKNIGIVVCLEEMMKKKLSVPENPQIVSALGAALIAAEQGVKG